MSTSSNDKQITLANRLQPLICYFTILEIFLLCVILRMPQSEIHKELHAFGILNTWPTTIIAGCLLVYAGVFWRPQIPHLPPFISTGQALNAISWSVVGFIHLNTPISGGIEVASGLFFMAICNMVMAVWLELFGHRVI